MTERLYISLPEDPGPGPEATAPTAHITTLAVPRHLKWAVRQALIYRETFAQDEGVWERVLPDGSVRLVGDLSAGPGNPAILVLGPRTRAEQVHLRGRMEGLSLALTLAAARAILGAPVGEVTDRDVALSDLWGPFAQRLGDRLANEQDDDRRGEAIWSALQARLAQAEHRSRRPLAADQPACRNVSTVRELGIALGLGERRMQQLFQDEVGMPPGRFLRLTRWQGLIRRLRGTPRPNWAALALDHGYCDQSHMVREFRAFTGLSPTDYHRRAVAGSSKTSA